MQEHKYQAREKPVREIEREEKTKIRQEGKGLARDRPIEKVLLEKNITDKETVPAEKEKQEVSAGQRKKKQNTLRSLASHREEDVDGKFTREPVTISEPEKKVEGENGKEELSEHSLRMGNFRGKAKNQSLESESSQRDSRKKKLVQEHARKRKTEGENSVNPEEEKGRKPQDNSLENVREKKQKQKRLQEETARSQKKLSFSDEGNGMIRGAGMGIAKKGISVTASTIENSLQTQETDENAATEGAKQSGILSEKALRYAVKKSRRQAQYHKGRYKEEESVKNSLHFDFVQGTTDNIKTERAGKQAQERKHLLNRFWQKQRYKKARQAAQQGEKTTAEAAKTAQTFLEKAKSIVTSFFKTHKGFLGIVIAILLFVLMIGVGMSSCSAVFQGTVSTVVGTTYASDDEDIYAVEAAYSKLEAELNQQINSMEARHEGYEEYRYQVDEISHNPYHLISYFTALYGDFTYEQVAGEIEEIFQQQYHLTTEATKEVVTETKKVKVGESLGKVVTSGYCNCSICCGSWSGGPTASGVYPKANHTIAVDANNPFVPIGTKVVMNGVEYTVEDTGAFARYGVQFDVYYDNHAAASAHGHQTWEAFIADINGKNEIEVTTTQEVNRMDITLTNKGLDAVLRSRMDENEEKRYDIYNTTYGNRDYLFDKNTIPMGGGNGGFGYEIPPEALTDERFANMIREAEKYLGYPYVWGGASPSTSFDCSGFVSWVINNCGNGWNVGRQTADGLRSCCAYVPPEQAKPGDLIFFQGTYDTPGASHVGIYVGNQVMIHCGDPIQYANISTPYWQQHFMAFGRLP